MFWFLITLLSVVMIGFLCWKSLLKQKSPLHNIPGPKGIPVLGNIFDISSDPKKSLQELHNLSQEYDGIFKMNLGPLGTTLLISDPKYFEVILNSPIHINKGGWYHLLHDWIGEGIALVNGSKWKNIRRLLSPVFNTKVLEGFCQKIDERNREFVEELRSNVDKNFDITKLLDANSYLILMKTLIGEDVDPKVSKNYMDNVNVIMQIHMKRLFSLTNFDFIFRLSKDYKKSQIAIEASRSIIKDFIKKKKHDMVAKPTDAKKSFLDLLLELQDQNPDITDMEILQHIDTFIFAGHDTISASLSFAIYELSCSRDLQERLLQESNAIFGNDLSVKLTLKELESAEYLSMFCKEVLRKFPAAPMIARITTEPLKFGEFDIPIGTNVFILIFSMQRTPKIYPDPLKFNPERFSAENKSMRSECALSSFSHGPRNCIGQRFAMLEMRSVITMLVRHFVVSKEPDFDISLVSAGVMKPLSGVRVKIIERCL